MQRNGNTYVNISVFTASRDSSAAKLGHPTDIGNAALQKALLVLMGILLTAVFTAFPDISKKAVAQSLKLCAETLIPSLFPFMIASGLMLSGGSSGTASRVFERLFRALFGLSGAGAGCFLLGAAAGFPIGAKSVCTLTEKGGCSISEAERLLALCSNPSISFTVAVIGRLAWGSSAFGLKLWLICLTSSVLTGIIFKLSTANNAAILRDFKKADAQASSFSVSDSIVSAVKDAVASMLKICGFVIFSELIISVFTEFTAHFVNSSPQASISSEIALTAISSFLEFSSGALKLAAVAQAPMAEAARENAVILAKSVTTAATAWSGFSVHMQVSAFAVPCGINMKRYYGFKATATVIAVTLSSLLLLMHAY